MQSVPDSQQPMQSVPITTKAVSSNPAHGDGYSTQNYVIKFVSDLWQVSGFLQDLDVHLPMQSVPIPHVARFT